MYIRVVHLSQTSPVLDIFFQVRAIHIHITHMKIQMMWIVQQKLNLTRTYPLQTLRKRLAWVLKMGVPALGAI